MTTEEAKAKWATVEKELSVASKELDALYTETTQRLASKRRQVDRLYAMKCRLWEAYIDRMNTETTTKEGR
jgi:hypothetical protein